MSEDVRGKPLRGVAPTVNPWLALPGRRSLAAADARELLVDDVANLAVYARFPGASPATLSPLAVRSATAVTPSQLPARFCLPTDYGQP